MVFRGVLYNRIKRFYSIPCSVIFSALLFGIFHANLPQLIYGTLMGVLIAVCYEKNKCFGAPVIFHMAANIFIFSMSFI
jgi:membrane protease YdiL (CAAX protease family)